MKRTPARLSARQNRAYIGFITPGLFLYTLLVIIPIACSIFYSFFEWSGIGPMKFVGLENFRYLLFGERMSGVFFNALKNNLIYLLCVLLIITPIQLFTAYLLYLKIPCHKYIRTMTFLPYVLSTSIVGFFALLLFDGNMGVLNTVIKALFGRSHTQSWLGDPKLMFPIFVLIVIWQCASSGTMIFFADMQSLVTNITLSVIYAMTMFGLPYVLVGTSGGVNNRLDFIAMVFYRYAFGGTYYGTTDIGFGSAISVVMLIIILTAWLVTNHFLKRMRD